MRNKKITRHIMIQEKEFISTVKEMAQVVAEVVAKTMTAKGDYVSLLDGTTTNDGATIVSKLNDSNLDLFHKNPALNAVLEMYLQKLTEATEKTDELAGDGTSATTLLTYLLIKYVNDRKQALASKQVILNDLKEFEKNAIKYLEVNKRGLKTKDDYKKLAIVSTKDDELGSLIGEAIFDAGDNAAIQLEQSRDKTEDYVEYKTHFMLPSTLVGHGIPESMENPEIIIVNGPVKEQSAFLTKIAEYTFEDKRNVVILTTEIGQIALEFIQSINQANAGKGSLTILPIPEPASKLFKQDDLVRDIASYINAEVYSPGVFNESMLIKDAKLGTVDKFEMTNEYTIFNNEKVNESNEARVKELKDQLAKINSDIEVEKAKTLKTRINMLSGKTVKLFVYANNESALQTKVYRVQDAVKSTQFALGNGYVLGAGSFYRGLSREEGLDKELQEVMLRMEKNIFDIDGKEYGDADAKRDLKEGLIINKKDGTSKFGDLHKEGIIDSAKVVENVIKNSVSIAYEFASIGVKILQYEEYEGNNEDDR